MDGEKDGARIPLHVLAEVAMDMSSTMTSASASDDETDMPDVEAYSSAAERDKAVERDKATERDKALEKDKATERDQALEKDKTTERDKSAQDTTQPYVYAFDSAVARRKFLCGVPILQRHPEPYVKPTARLFEDVGYFGEAVMADAAQEAGSQEPVRRQKQKPNAIFGVAQEAGSQEPVQPEAIAYSRGGGARLSDAGALALKAFQDNAGWEEQDGKMVVCWKIGESGMLFMDQVLRTEGVTYENKASLPGSPDGASLDPVDDLILAPMQQFEFLPNVVSMTPDARENIACAMELGWKTTNAMQKAEQDEDSGMIQKLKKKARQTFTRRMNALGYHVRIGTGLNTQYRYNHPDVKIQYILRLHNWNTHARSAAKNGNGRQKLGGKRRQRKSRAKVDTD